MKITCAAWLLVVLSLALCADPPQVPKFQAVERPTISCLDWDERRWTEFLGNRANCEPFVATAFGPLADLVNSDTVWKVAYDTDWRSAVSESILMSVALEREPGIWLLCPDGRTQHYTEAQVVVQRLRAYGLPLRIRTMAVAPRKGEVSE